MCRLATLILSSPRVENLSLCFSETNPDTRMQKSNLNGSFPLCWRRQRSPPRAAPCEKQRRPLYVFFVQARCTAVMLSSRLCSCSSSDHLLSDYQIILCSWTARKGLKFIWNWSCTSTFYQVKSSSSPPGILCGAVIKSKSATFFTCTDVSNISKSIVFQKIKPSSHHFPEASQLCPKQLSRLTMPVKAEQS